MKTASKPATAKRNGLALESCDVPDSAVKKHRTERERRAAFDRLAAEFGPTRGKRSVAKAIAAFSREFMLKPGERGIDAVGALIKSRGRACSVSLMPASSWQHSRQMTSTTAPHGVGGSGETPASTLPAS